MVCDCIRRGLDIDLWRQIVMEGKIDKDGNLEIKRGKKYKVQACFYGGDGCGDWCPQFGEHSLSKSNGMTYLRICQKRILEFKDFEDERTQDGKE